MTARFFALLTNIGAAKLANATALGTRLEITQMAVGDGGGTLPTPNPAQTKLVNEQRRAALNTLSIDPINTSQIIAEQVIPEAEGGWWIREIGLLDKDGDLIAIANCAETYKPLMQEGSGRTQTIRVILIVSSTAAVTLKIDPSVVLATRQYVDKKTDDKAIEVKQYADNLLTEHEKSRNHPDASKTEKGFVKLSSATTSDSEVLASTPKAVKIVAEAAAKALGDHSKEANPHDQYLQIANLLSEIKAQGPAALAETLENLGLGDAAKSGIAGVSSGLKIVTSGIAHPVLITASEVCLKSSGIQRTVGNISLALNLNNSGVNGLDMGVVASSEWYSVWVISNGITVAALGSLSQNAPTLPPGYTFAGRIGWIRTDATANKYPLSMIQMGRTAQYKVSTGSNVANPPIMASGVASTPVAVSTSNFVPPTAAKIKLAAGAIGVGSVSYAPNNNYIADPTSKYLSATYPNGYPYAGGYAPSSAVPTANGELILESTSVYYAASSTGGILICLGWEENI